MKKTRSLIGKTLLTTLILMLLSVPFMTKASAYTAAALPVASAYMDPFRIQGNAGDTVQVYLRVSNVEVSQPLFSFQAGLTFDPNVVNCSAVINGGFIDSNGGGSIGFPGTIDNDAGIITPYGWFLTNPNNAVSGSGALMQFTFHVEVTGYSDIHVTDYLPLDNTATEISMNVNDYFTAVFDSVEYVVKIVGNPIGTKVGMPPTGFSDHKVTPVSIVIGPDTYKGELTFNVSATGANLNPFAFFNVTIPKSLMSCPTVDQWRVSLNDVLQGGRVISGNATHTIVSLQFTYGSTSIAVQMLSIDIVPEFSSVFFASLLVLATFAAALFGKTAWSHKRKS